MDSTPDINIFNNTSFALKTISIKLNEFKRQPSKTSTEKEDKKSTTNKIHQIKYNLVNIKCMKGATLLKPVPNKIIHHHQLSIPDQLI